MQIQCECDFIGQKVEGFQAMDQKRGGVVRRNWVNVYLASDDGEAFMARVYLPDGEVGDVQPFAKRGDRVVVMLTGFSTIKGAVVATAASVVPIKKK